MRAETEEGRNDVLLDSPANTADMALPWRDMDSLPYEGEADLLSLAQNFS